MVVDSRVEGLKEKLKYLSEEAEAVHSGDVEVRRKAALNVGAWMYAIEQLAHRFKDLDRLGFTAAMKPVIDAFCSNAIIDWWLLIRHKVIHDTPPGFKISTHVSYIDSDMINQINQSAPNGAVGIFIGDELGGAGWEILGNDGESTKVYFSLPSSIANSEVNFPDPPDGKKIGELADEAYQLTESFVADVIKWVESTSR